MSTPTQRRFWFRNRLRLLQIYLLLLLLSHLFTWAQQKRAVAPGPPPARETPSAPSPLRTLVLLDPLHGSAPWVEAYLQSRSLTTPALPGLNAPARAPVRFDSLGEDVAARYLSENLPPALLLANGHAGAIAVHLAARHPERVAGLVLIDASGVQELSLLGEYHLNYALYFVSEKALRLFHLLVPHFNAFPRLRVQQAQTTLLRLSDRRALRPQLAEVAQPVLILNRSTKTLVQLASKEYERLLPQSRRLSVGAETLEETLAPHLGPLQAGLLPERAASDPERIEASTRPFPPASRPRVTGFLLALLLFAIAIGTIFTEEFTCLLTGLMIANGNLSWTQGLLACILGILLFDGSVYLLARNLGRPALARAPLRWLIDPLVLRKTERWFDRRAGEAILITRFFPGTHLPAYVAAGLLGVPLRTFFTFFLLATLIWTPLVVWLAVVLAEQALVWIARFQHTAPALLLALLAAYLLFVHLLLPACSWQGRRKLLGRWRRLTQPEFWPASVLYAPVVLRLLLRSLKRGRHLLDFTACNPAIPGSGFVGESKHGILDQIGERAAILPYCVLPGEAGADENHRRAADWMREQHIPYPVFLKPDVGQRGGGVRKIHSEQSLRRALARLHGTHLLQEAARGREYGVFYARNPSEARGRVIAITRKTLPVVLGDGRRKLEDLLLADERAVIGYRTYREQLGDRLYTIPAAGETVTLSPVGNHARGTLFEDGMHLCTPELEARIDEISRSFPGFSFGRYDLFAPGDEALSRGENLRIVELNGVTSEATSLYRPGSRYRDMVRALWKTWALASDIGRAHREAGAPLLRLRDLLQDFDQACRLDHARKLRSLDGQLADKDCQRPEMQ